MNALVRFFVFLVAAEPVACAFADSGPFKCRGTGGSPVYQQQPCPTGTGLRDLAEDPATLSVIPFQWAAPHETARASRAERPVKASAKPDKRKADVDRRTSEAAVVERRHVKDGMSDGEVLARLGPPDLQSGKTGRKMRWTYLPAPGDPQTVTLLRFEDGKVITIERTTMR